MVLCESDDRFSYPDFICHYAGFQGHFQQLQNTLAVRASRLHEIVRERSNRITKLACHLSEEILILVAQSDAQHNLARILAHIPPN